MPDKPPQGTKGIGDFKEIADGLGVARPNVNQIGDDIAMRLYRAAKRGKLLKIDADIIRAACIMVGAYEAFTDVQVEDLFRATTRKVVERAA